MQQAGDESCMCKHMLLPAADLERSKDCPEGRVDYETLESNPNPNANQES
jgi:hypothetical protein